MSKDGSEDGQQGRKEVPATGQSPLPAYGSHAIQKILERVSPSNVLEYRAMLDEAGFDTLESLTLPVAEFREEVTGMKAGHARALINMVVEERARRSTPRKLDFIEQGTPPVPVSTRDNSIEKRALAGKFPKFPSNEEDDQRKVMLWFVGVASWSRIWSLDIANACVFIERHPNQPLTGSGISSEKLRSARFLEEDSHWGNCFVVEHQNDSSVMGLLTGAQKDYPKMTEILARMADIFAPKHEDYVTQLRIKFINMTPCTQEHRLQSALIEWEELREELKTRGNEQGSIEVLASLKLLLSGLSKVQSLLSNAKMLWGVEKIGLDKLLELAKGCGKDWVRLKPKSNPKPTPKHPNTNPKHNPTPKPDEPKETPKPTPTPSPNVMMGSMGSRPLYHCDAWCFKHRNCALKGASEGGVNDGVSQCKFMHDPSMENTDPKHRIAHFNTIPCKFGSAKECPCLKLPQGCHFKHS